MEVNYFGVLAPTQALRGTPALRSGGAIINVLSFLALGKPSPLTWSEAAGLPLPGLTAYRAVVRDLAVQRNETVLIRGAAGAVGSLAVQIARVRGARVIGVDAESQHQY